MCQYLCHAVALLDVGERLARIGTTGQSFRNGLLVANKLVNIYFHVLPRDAPVVHSVADDQL